MQLNELVQQMVGHAFDAGTHAMTGENLDAMNDTRRVIVGTDAGTILSAIGIDRQEFAEMITQSLAADYAVKELGEFSERYKPLPEGADLTGEQYQGGTFWYDAGVPEPQDVPQEAAVQPVPDVVPISG